MLIRSQKIALNPNNKQSTLLSQHAGYARVAFNFGLSSFKSGLDKDEWRSYIDIKREFNAVKHDKFDWCSDLSQNASKNALHNLGDAVSRWKSGLLKNRKLAKALSDSALSRFLTMLRYKADRRGIPITEADQFFASSPTCSNCGHKKTDLTLSERTYHCTECDFECNRDLNAAINLCPAQP